MGDGVKPTATEALRALELQEARWQAILPRRPFVRMIPKPVGYDALHQMIHDCAPRDSARG